MIREQLHEIEKKALAKAAAAKSEKELFTVFREYLGKTGKLKQILKGLGQLSPEERRITGQLSNDIKNKLTTFIEERKAAIMADAPAVEREIDLTVPGIPPLKGGLHPTTQMCYDLNEAFRSLGFVIFSENEISSELYAFDNLNFPPDHPARESMDTYWLQGTEDKKGADRLCLRPHLTGASVRYLREHGAPARIIYPGHVFRNESTDARHERAFVQYEALIVDKELPFASGKLLIDTSPDLVGKQVAGMRVEHLDDLNELIQVNKIDIALIAVPEKVAVEVAQRLVDAGVSALYNFTQAELHCLKDVYVESANISYGVLRLAHHLSGKWPRKK